MAKKLLSVLTILLLTFSLTACVDNANRKAAADLDMKIMALGESNAVTLDKAECVKETKKAYDTLTSEQKKLVTKLNELLQAERRISDLENASSVDAKITALGEPDTITLDKADDIKAARTAYDALSSVQKGYVIKFDALKIAENQIYLIEKEKAEDDRIAAVKSAAKETTQGATAQKTATQTKTNNQTTEQTEIEKALAELAAADKAAAQRQADITNYNRDLSNLTSTYNNLADNLEADAQIKKNAIHDDYASRGMLRSSAYTSAIAAVDNRLESDLAALENRYNNDVANLKLKYNI